MDRLLRKIEAIRKEPEHVRMRYVMVWVAVSMVFVLILFIFSVYEGIRSTARSDTTVPGMNLPEAPSFESFSGKGDLKDAVTGADFFQKEHMKSESPTESNLSGKSQ